MSFYTENPSRHDLFVGLAVRRLLGHLEGGRLVHVDGGVPFIDTLAPPSPNMVGYRPDAVLHVGSRFIFVEVKSAADVLSSHTALQLEILGRFLAQRPDDKFYLFLFDVDEQEKRAEIRLLLQKLLAAGLVVQSLSSEGSVVPWP